MAAAAWLAVPAMALAGCGSQLPMEALAPLSTIAKEENGKPLGMLIRNLCVESAADRKRFQQILNSSRWSFRQTQEADSNNPATLEVWQAPFTTVIRSPTPIAGQVWTCSVSVSVEAAPSLETLSAVLTSVADGNSAVSDEIGWQWRPSPARVVHMTLASGSLDDEAGATIFLEVTELTPVQVILGI